MPARGRGYETGLMLLLSFAFGFVFFDRNSMNYLTPFVAPELGMSNTQIGLLSSGFSFAWAVVGYLGGAMSDATGRRKSFLVVTFFIFSVCSVLSGLATSFVVLLACRILMGMSEGPIMPVTQSLVALESGESRRGLNMGFVQNFGSNLIGSTVAPLVLVKLANLYGWRTAFYIAGIPGLILCLLIWRFVREPRIETVASATDRAPKLRPLEMLGMPNLALCILISIFMVPWMILAWVFMPVYYVSVRHLPTSEMSVLMSVLGVSAAVFSFIVPGISDRIGRKPVVAIFSFVGVLTPLALLYATGPVWVMAALVFLGWSASGVFPLFMATIPAETVPPRYLATSMGLVMGLGELIGGVGTPVAAGWAADRYGLRAPFYIECVLALVAGVLALLLTETAPARINGRRRQPPPAFEPPAVAATAAESPRSP